MAVFGCIADDFTGASDAASFLVKGGMSVQLYNGVPDHQATVNNISESSAIRLAEAQAIVVALKSRTQNADRAVADSLEATRFLLAQDVEQIYFKYCSTFDSTPKGNIGPVADALIDFLKVPYTLLCPALPVNGRTVENGNIMVNGVFLHESHMKNHPLTPMWESRIDKLMEPQSRYPSRNFTLEKLKNFSLEGTSDKPFYIIPDYRNLEDGDEIVAVFGQLPLLTGGSGLLEPLARVWTKKLFSKGKIPTSGTKGKALLVAGSCSKATLEQIAWYRNQRKPCYKLNPKALMVGRQTIEHVWRFIEEYSGESDTVLIYSSDTPNRVKQSQELGKEKVAAMLEDTMAALAVRAVKSGYTRIISAGGETSGAITKGLGFSSYWIGESVAPGVPIMVPVEKPNIRLILKSGNFGQEDFFERALTATLK